MLRVVCFVLIKQFAVGLDVLPWENAMQFSRYNMLQRAKHKLKYVIKVVVLDLLL